MPEKVQQAASTESLVMTLNRAANRAATDAVVRYSELRGEDAERVARYAVHAAAPKIRAAYQAIILGTTKKEAAMFGAAAVGLLAANLIVNVSVIRCGSRLGRYAAGIAILGQAVMVTYSQGRDRRLRNAVASGTKPGAA